MEMIWIYQRKYFKKFRKWFDKEKSNVKVKALTLTRCWLSVKLQKKKRVKYYKNYISKTREKMENYDIYFMIFREQLDVLWFIENQWSEKSWNEHFGQNHQID